MNKLNQLQFSKIYIKVGDDEKESVYVPFEEAVQALQKQIEMIEGEIEHQKEQLQKETGAFKYDFVYDGVLSILSQYK